MIAAASAPMNYSNEAYESPPPVADAPAGESHTLSTEEFDETPVILKEKSKTTIKDAIIMASRCKPGDEVRKMTPRSIFRIINYACFLILFLEVEFMSSLYKSDDPFTVDEAAMVYYNNRLLGRPRIRMLKVRNDSCTVIASFAREITECFSNFNPIVEDRATIPPGTSEAYVWQSASVLMTETVTGTIASYTGGGFLLQLPLDDPTKAVQLINGVKSNRWIDRGTRALIIDFSLFNANVRNPRVELQPVEESFTKVISVIETKEIHKETSSRDIPSTSAKIVLGSGNDRDGSSHYPKLLGFLIRSGS
ncbi:hypothetical protein TELCIR_16547 [Teladorsagia circumcincta]|uniref:Polycystin domain-containing protein n=1 Tax=Teladorsagia circumcincta TaxID=45464 RepID=A0A2G9TVG3_TELCI|nr:hypothetical protein TELCIR_16547 [Teladorsagia circumcincta]